MNEKYKINKDDKFHVQTRYYDKLFSENRYGIKNLNLKFFKIKQREEH